MPKIKTPKVVSNPITSITNAANSAVNTVTNATNSAVNTVVDTTNTAVNSVTNAANSAVNAVVDTTNGVVNDVVNLADEFVDEVTYAEHWVSNQVMREENINELATKVYTEAKNAGIPLDKYVAEFDHGIEFAKQQVIHGVESVEWVVQYLDQQACQIGLTAALCLCFSTLLNPANPEAEAAAAPLSVAAIAFKAAQSAATISALTGAAYGIALGITEALWLIPEVRNGMKKDGKALLCSVLSNAIYYSIQTSIDAWLVPASDLMVMSAIFSVLISNLICTGTIPGGYKVFDSHVPA